VLGTAAEGNAAHLSSEFARGISYAHDWSAFGAMGYGSHADARELTHLAQLGANWVSVMPFAYVPTTTPPTIVASYVRRGTESDTAMQTTIAAAHARSLKVLLKPHLWVPRSWPGALGANASEAQQWTAQWRSVVLHYAEFAEQSHADAYCIGTEMDSIATLALDAWRSLIGEVRAIYHGRLAYCGNWNSLQNISFFDLLDVIGVQDYAPRVDHARATQLTARELLARTQVIMRGYAALGERWHKPVWLTEAGFRCDSDALVEPWRYSDRSLTACDCEVQRVAYDSTLQSASENAVIQGIFVWKWFTSGGLEDEGSCGFAIHHEPTVSTLRRWFR
jgi:hypothetical protein